MTINSLPPEKLSRVCAGGQFRFRTTADLDTGGEIIGQPRGTRSIAFGLGMQGQGFNVFVVGDTGTGRTTAIRRFLEQRAARQPAPPDFVYVHNFAHPHRPQALSLPAGRGAALQAGVSALIDNLRRELPGVFAGDESGQAAAVDRHFPQLEAAYAGLPQVLAYLKAMRQDILNHLHDFLANGEQEAGDGRRPAEAQNLLRRYEVNLFVDNSRLEGAPVVAELHPSYLNLIGRMEYELYQGLMAPHFTTLRAGSLHRANGGYLIVYARDIGRHVDAWEALKRALKAREIQLQPPEALHGSHVLAQSLEPAPIPLQVKVILLGSEEMYYAYFDQEDEFSELFKVKAEFDSSMVRDDAHELQYAQFIAERCRQEGLRHFDCAAVTKIVEYGSRLCEDQNRLSTRFGDIADFIREANYWATEAGRDVVTVEDVYYTLSERVYRANRVEERIREQILQGDLLIATEGAVVGQVNSLSVLDLGDYTFGSPGRITARTYMGEDGVVNIEREVDMAGPIHNKGLLTLIGYLGGTYAQDQPLSLSASLTFEQNYMEIDGDSASAAELYALLSSLSELPVRQSVAVTGSINQHGQMQAVGGVTEKIEGFFQVCTERGLTGEQGVLIPQANVNNLMLREEVVQAVEEELFHVWAINSVDEGMGLLLGVPAGEREESGHYPPGTVHHIVQRALQRLALDLKSFGDRGEHDDQNER